MRRLAAGALVLALLGGCRSGPTGSGVSEESAYNALVARADSLAKRMREEAPLLARSGNARRLLALRQNEGFAPVGVETGPGGPRVSDAFASLGRLEAQLSKQFSRQQKQEMDQQAPRYNALIQRLKPLMEGGRMWQEDLRARKGLIWSASPLSFEWDEGFLMSRRKVVMWLAPIEGSAHRPPEEEARAQQKMVDLVLDWRRSLERLEPALMGLARISGDRWEGTPSGADQQLRRRSLKARLTQESDPRRRGAIEKQLQGIPQVQAPPLRFPFRDEEKEEMDRLRSRIGRVDLSRGRQQMMRLLRLASAAGAWQEALMDEPSFADRYRIAGQEVIGIYGDAPMGAVVLYRFAPR